MSPEPNNSATDLRGAGRLTVDALVGATDLVESLHRTITTFGGWMDGSRDMRMGGLSGLVYDNIRSITDLVGTGLDRALARLAEALGESETSVTRDIVVCALNGVLGDYLEATDNPLAVEMQFRRDGRRLEGVDAPFREAVRAAGGRMLVLLHGNAASDWQWQRDDGHDHGRALADDLGYLPLYLRYNSGLHISQNGAELADRLQRLSAQLPGPITWTFLGHSMGGLLARSAYYYGRQADHNWVDDVEAMLFLGTPHHGAPLEQYSNRFEQILEATPYTAPLAKLGKLRSAGITDMRYGNLLHEDWDGRDRFAHAGDNRHPVPLPEDVDCYALAATTRGTIDDLSERFHWDRSVTVPSALGHHDDPAYALDLPEDHQWVGTGMSHIDLLEREPVYDVVKRWLERG